MFIINTNFTVDPARATPHQQDHKQWVANNATQGYFIYAGPRVDNNGGIIVADCLNITELNRILSEDAYVIHKLISVEIQEFNAVFKAA